MVTRPTDLTAVNLTSAAAGPAADGTNTNPRSSPPLRRGEAPASLDEGRYWVGVVLTAGIAALTAAVGLVLAGGVLRLHVVLDEAGHLVPVRLGALVLLAAAVTVGAGALYHLMVVVAPRPPFYYSWLAGLGTVLAVAWPFAGDAPLRARVAVAVISLAVGLVILLLIPRAAVRSRR